MLVLNQILSVPEMPPSGRVNKFIYSPQGYKDLYLQGIKDQQIVKRNKQFVLGRDRIQRKERARAGTRDKGNDWSCLENIFFTEHFDENIRFCQISQQNISAVFS